MQIFRLDAKTNLEEDAKSECKSPRLQEAFQKSTRTDSPSFLAKRINGSSTLRLATGRTSLINNVKQNFSAYSSPNTESAITKYKRLH